MKNVLLVLGRNDGQMEVIKHLVSAAGIELLQPSEVEGRQEFSPGDLGLKVVTVNCGHPEFSQKRTTVEHDPWIVFVECGPKDWPTGGPEPGLINQVSRKTACLTQVIAALRALPARLRQNAAGGNYRDKNEAHSLGLEIETVLQFSAATARWIELVAANDLRGKEGMVALGATYEEMNHVVTFDRKARGEA